MGVLRRACQRAKNVPEAVVRGELPERLLKGTSDSGKCSEIEEGNTADLARDELIPDNWGARDVVKGQHAG